LTKQLALQLSHTFGVLTASLGRNPAAALKVPEGHIRHAPFNW
jgi:hypothetical protein